MCKIAGLEKVDRPILLVGLITRMSNHLAFGVLFEVGMEVPAM